MAPKRINLTGNRFGRLVVVSELNEYKNGSTNRNRHFNVACDCGEMSVVRIDVLRNGETQSCGCLRHEVSRKILVGHRRTTHGDSGITEYNCLRGIIQRCEQPSHKSYFGYGGRGIKVCQRWRYGEDGLSGYECFIADMGYKPSPTHSLDRINNDGHYEPTNCRWATPQVQANNRRPRPARQAQGYSFYGIITI